MLLVLGFLFGPAYHLDFPTMWHPKLLLSLCLSWVLFIQSTYQLQNSRKQALLQLREHLEFPPALEPWGSYYGDLCGVSATAHMSISCQGNFVTELKIMGDKLFKVPDLFHGYAIPNHTLSESFSIDSLVTTLTRLTSLRVLSLVSLGIWGRLPGKIHRLSVLEYLDLSSNYLFGSVPPEISRLVKLQTLVLDGNYFNGSVPNILDSLTNLTVLSLKSNRLDGPFPSSICRIRTLTNVALSHNGISGKLPDLSNLADLHMLDLRENHLDSALPSMPKALATVLLSKNSFSGKIPESFGELDQLQHLDLSFNHLLGTLSPVLFSLPNISYLDLASNKLSGALSLNLNCSDKLGVVDLSNNRLIGSLPSCLANASGERVVRVGGNCLSINGDQEQHQKSFCQEASTEKKHARGRTIGIFVAVIAGAVLILVFSALGLFLLYRKSCSRETPVQQARPKAAFNNPPNGVSSEVLASARLISQAAQGAPAWRSFSIEELKEATEYFDSSTCLGKGSKGKLHKGILKDGTCVAVRFLDLSKKFSSQNIRARLEWLSKLNHPHLVSFLGHCMQSSGEYDHATTKLFLVYEYIPNGTYRTHLSESHPEKILTWPDRLAILIDIAKAVHFLHTGVIPGSFNNQLRTNNILLDEHRIAKLSDCGLSVIVEENEQLEAKAETPKSSKTAKIIEDDVYDFGFILLESLIGPVASAKGEAILLNEMSQLVVIMKVELENKMQFKTFVGKVDCLCSLSDRLFFESVQATSFGSQDSRRRIVDPTVLATSSQESLAIVVAITNKCVSPERSSRPSFEDVLWNLQYAAQVQAASDSEQRSDSML